METKGSGNLRQSVLKCLYSGISDLQLNLFQKTAREAICSKTQSPLLPQRRVTDHTGNRHQRIVG